MALLILVQGFNEQEHFCEKLIAFDAPGAAWVKKPKKPRKAETLYSYAAPERSKTQRGRRRRNFVLCIRKIFNY